MRIRVSFTVSVAVALALAAILAFTTAYRLFHRAPLPVSIAYPSLLSSSLFFVADAQGYFREEGLTATLREYPTGRDALQDMLQGKADLAVAYETPLLIQACSGTNLSVYARLHSADHNTGLVMRGASAAALRGKKVAVVRGTNADFVLSQLLYFSGLTPADVTVVDVPSSAPLDAFRRGEVDAVSVWQPYLRQAKEIGGPQATVLFSDVYTEASFLLSREGFLPGSTEKTERVLRALSRAETFIRRFPAESRDIVQRSLPNVSADDVDAFWDDYAFGLNLGNDAVTSFQLQLEWLDRQPGSCARIPDIFTLVEPSPLQQVDESAVTLPQQP